MARAVLVLIVTLAAAAASAQPVTEVARVRAHLQSARAVAAARDIASLTDAQRAKRAASLAVLDRYIARGVFPVRTDDGYVGLRPRFIDARGVHCAVGEMIAQSGEEPLARAINAELEYGYVRDIAASPHLGPQLVAWADEHGFTLDELARIQPRYRSPPTLDGVRRQIEENKDTYMLACADATPPARVTVHAAGNGVDVTVADPRDGRVTISAPAGSTAFARCFASGAATLPQAGGAFSPSPSPFAGNLTFDLRTPMQVLESRMRDQVGFAEHCAPRPGARSTRAVLAITSTPEAGFGIAVSTTPANAEINKCIEDYVEPRIRDFQNVAGLAYKHTIELRRVTSRRVHDAVLRRAAGFATDCYAAEGTPTQLSIAVTAKPDDKAFTLTTSAANEPFSRCVTDKLQASLRADFTVKREVAEGKQQSYFRIDGAVDTTVAVAVELPADRDARLERAREEQAKRANERRRLLEAELARQRYQ